MKKTTWVALGLLVVSLAIVGCGAGQGEDGSSQGEAVVPVVFNDLENVFAMADESGQRLIVFSYLEEAPELEALNVAIGAGNDYLSVKYAGEQAASAEDSYRIVAANFDNLGGYLFDVVEGKAVPDQTYFITSSQVVAEAQLLKMSQGKAAPLSKADQTMLAEAKQKDFQDGWILADYADGSQLLQVVFAGKGAEQLMSIVFKNPAGVLKFSDYPASGDEYSAWRVDDGGLIAPEDFRVCFSVLTDRGYTVALSWAGPEGESTFVLQETETELVQTPLEGYRYWSPI
jgi:predicted small secreted protein